MIPEVLPVLFKNAIFNIKPEILPESVPVARIGLYQIGLAYFLLILELRRTLFFGAIRTEANICLKGLGSDFWSFGLKHKIFVL